MHWTWTAVWQAEVVAVAGVAPQAALGMHQGAIQGTSRGALPGVTLEARLGVMVAALGADRGATVAQAPVVGVEEEGGAE